MVWTGSTGSGVRDGRRAQGMRRELETMAAKWHINRRTNEPAECKATVRDCPVGGTHYDSKEDAYRAIEQGYAADFAKKTNSLSKAKAFLAKYGSTDPEINSIVAAAVGKGTRAKLYKYRDEALAPGGGREVHVKTVAMSQQTKEMVQSLNNAYAAHDEVSFHGHHGAEYAATAKSLENVSADAELLRSRLLETIAGGANRTYGDVMYVAGNKTPWSERSGMLVQTAVSFDSDALAEDMASKGYDIRDVQDTHSSLSVSKLKKFIFGAADWEGASKGTMIDKAKRDKSLLRDMYLAETGVFRTETTWSPDKKQIDALAHDHPEAIDGRMFTEEQVSKMGASQVRAALITVGARKAELTRRLAEKDNMFVKAGWRPADKNADGSRSGGSKPEAGGQNDGLTFKPRNASVVADGAAAVAWVKAHGGDPSELMTRRTYVKAEKLEAFSKKHPEVSYYKYAKPVQRVRTMERFGFEDGMSTFA